ncbi:hypothetical protein ACJ41O_008831 [Fusarium nematophilum]
MPCFLGHGHPEMAKAIQEHASKPGNLFSGMVSPPVISLAERHCKLLPPGLDKAFFLSSGGESNEAATWMAKIYTGKFEIVALGGSWHDTTTQSVATQYHAGRKGHGPLIPGMHMLPGPNTYRSPFRKPVGSYDLGAELAYGWNLVDTASCGSRAACIIECIQSSAGMHVLHEGYLKAPKKEGETRRVILMVDKAQTGIGPCGDLVAINHDGGARHSDLGQRAPAQRRHHKPRD